MKGRKRGKRVQKRIKLEEIAERQKRDKSAVGILKFFSFAAIILRSNKRAVRAVRSGHSTFLCRLRFESQTGGEKVLSTSLIFLNT